MFVFPFGSRAHRLLPLDSLLTLKNDNEGQTLVSEFSVISNKNTYRFIINQAR